MYFYIFIILHTFANAQNKVTLPLVFNKKNAFTIDSFRATIPTSWVVIITVFYKYLNCH